MQPLRSATMSATMSWALPTERQRRPPDRGLALQSRALLAPRPADVQNHACEHVASKRSPSRYSVRCAMLGAIPLGAQRATGAPERRPHHHRRRRLRRPRRVRWHRRQDAEHRPARPRGREAHRLLRERLRTARRRARGSSPAATSSASRSSGRSAPTSGDSVTRSAGHRPLAAAAPQERRLRHGARRQVAPRMEAGVQSDRARIRLLLRLQERLHRLLPAHRRFRGQRRPVRERHARSTVPGYMTDLITERSVGFMARNMDRPFFLDVAYNAAHWPYQVPGLPSVAVMTDVTSPRSTVRRARAPTTSRSSSARTAASARILERSTGSASATTRSSSSRTTTAVNGSRGTNRCSITSERSGKEASACRRSCDGRAGFPPGRCRGRWAITMDLTRVDPRRDGTPVPADASLEGVNIFPILERRAPALERTLFWRVARGTQAACRPLGRLEAPDRRRPTDPVRPSRRPRRAEQSRRDPDRHRAQADAADRQVGSGRGRGSEDAELTTVGPARAKRACLVSTRQARRIRQVVPACVASGACVRPCLPRTCTARPPGTSRRHSST